MRRPSMRRGPTRKPPHPLFQDEDIEIEDGGDAAGRVHSTATTILNPREVIETSPSATRATIPAVLDLDVLVLGRGDVVAFGSVRASCSASSW